jgi:hypothetical protein
MLHFTNLSVLHRDRRAFLVHGALATLLAKKLICYQSAPDVANALHQTKIILLRGLTRPYVRFYVRVIYLGVFFSPKQFAMLAVTPWDSIGHIVDKTIDLIDYMERDHTLPMQLMYKGRILEEHKRVCDYDFIQPHCTLIAKIRTGSRGYIGSRIPTTPHE